MNPLLQLLELWMQLNALLNRRKESLISGNQFQGDSLPDIDIQAVSFDDEMDEEVQRVMLLIEENKALLAREKRSYQERQTPTKDRKKTRPMPDLNERIKAVKEMFDSYPLKPKKDMICFITYDITDNRIRKKISDYLEEKGCVRVQKSIFLAQIERVVFKTLQEGLASIAAAYGESDSIFFIPVPEDSLHKMRIIGKEIDFSITLGRSHTLFF